MSLILDAYQEMPLGTKGLKEATNRGAFGNVEAPDGRNRVLETCLDRRKLTGTAPSEVES